MQDQTFIDTVGHCAGLVLFGLLTILFWRNRSLEKTREGTLSCLIAVLVFVWNGAELVLLADPPKLAFQVAGVVSLFCLNFLPAVLLHLALAGRLRSVAATGYVLSTGSLLFQFPSGSAVGWNRPEASLVLLSVGFAVLGSAAWFWFEYNVHRKPRMPRLPRVALLSLLIFATSFLHFQPGHTAKVWVGEAIWHHAAIPIALIVLLSDYRFLLLDTFLRFTINAAWIALWIWLVATAATKLHLPEATNRSPFLTGLLVTALCFVVYAIARSLRPVQSILTQITFRRPALGGLLQSLKGLSVRSETDLLQAAAQAVGAQYDCRHAEVIASSCQFPVDFIDPAIANIHHIGMEGLPEWTVVVIPLRFSKGDHRCLCLGMRRGGRRFLSEDLRDLQKVQLTVVELMERMRRQELEHLAREAELKALQAQINPHFLFNALNTLYGTIGRDSPEARQLVLNLADVFRYRLQANRKQVTLQEEIEIVRAYLEIEALRLGSRLTAQIDIDDELRTTPIPILTIQPLVENAVKHGASPTGRIWVRLTIASTEGGVCVLVEDGGSGFKEIKQSSGTGLGLRNVDQRLRLCYGTKYGLDWKSDSAGSKVWFTVPRHHHVTTKT